MEKAKELDLLLVPYESKNGMEDTKEALSQIKKGMSVGILIGPEGGFDEQEIEIAKEAMGIAGRQHMEAVFDKKRVVAYTLSALQIRVK